MPLLGALLTVGLALLLAAPAQAGVRVNIWETFTTTEQTCSGDAVTITSRVHFTGVETIAPDGRYIVSGTHLAAPAAEGVTASGERYLMRSGSNSTGTNFEGEQGASTFSATIRFRLAHVGPGEGEDLTLRQVVHVTTTPDGDTTVSFVRSDGFLCV
jgi:hypothetical protein